MSDRTWEGRMLAILNGLEANGIPRNALKIPAFDLGSRADRMMGTRVSGGGPLDMAIAFLSGGDSTADEGLAKFLGMSERKDSEPFPLSNLRVTRYGKTAKDMIDSLAPGESKDAYVTKFGGMNAVDLGEGNVQESFSPEGVDIGMAGTIGKGGYNPGRFAMKIGKDESGAPYYELSDTYDFHEERVPDEGLPDPVSGVGKAYIGLLNALGKSFDMKSRYFFDPLTGQILR